MSKVALERVETQKTYDTMLLGKNVVTRVSAGGFDLTIGGDSVFKNGTLEDLRKAQSILGLSAFKMMLFQREEEERRKEEEAQKKRKEPINEFQEAHSPTEAVTVRLTGSRRKETARRRTTAVRLFDGLLEEHQDAMLDINDAFNDITGHVGGNIMLYEPDYVPGTGERGARKDIRRRTYMEWAGLGVGGKFNHGAALDIIAFGKDLKTVDTNRRKRHGWAKENLIAALDEWRNLRGWR